MKKSKGYRVLGLGLALTLFCGFGQAALGQDELPDAKKVIKKYIEAVGGMENLKRVSSTSVKGTMSISGADITGDLEVYQGKGKFLFKVDLGQFGTARIGINGDTVWEMNAQTGDRILEGAERDDRLENNGKPFPEVDWLNGYQGEYKCVSAEKIDGKLAYKVEFSSKSGNKTTRYFDAKSGLIVKAARSQMVQGQEVELTIQPGDYKKVEGVLLPHSQFVEMNGNPAYEISIDKITLNEKIADETFAIPSEIKELMDEK